MAKRRIIFTDNRQSKRGIMSLILSIICMISLVYSLIQSYILEGDVSVRFGGALVITLVMSIVGLGLGISARRDAKTFKLFPTLGMIINTVIVVILGFILWVGLN